MQGTPSNLHKSNKDLFELTAEIKVPEVQKNRSAFSRQISETHSTKSAPPFSNEDQPTKLEENKTNDQGAQMEASSKGTVTGSIIRHYIKAGAHWSNSLVLVFGFIFVQFLASGTDYWVSVW